MKRSYPIRLALIALLIVVIVGLLSSCDTGEDPYDISGTWEVEAEGFNAVFTVDHRDVTFIDLWIDGNPVEGETASKNDNSIRIEHEGFFVSLNDCRLIQLPDGRKVLRVEEITYNLPSLGTITLKQQNFRHYQD